MKNKYKKDKNHVLKFQPEIIECYSDNEESRKKLQKRIPSGIKIV